MTMQTTTAAAPRTPAETTGLLRRLAAAVASYRRRSRAEAELRRMSDRELHDLGLDRGSIAAGVRGRL